MRKHTEEGGWYGDNTLEGDWTSLHRDSHIILNGNRIELPEGQNVLFLVCKRWRDQILLAGQGQKDRNWLYKDNKWKDLGKSLGTFPCAFGPNELYFVSSNNRYKIYHLDTDETSLEFHKQLGAQGIRYIDFNQSLDGIVTGDSSYGPNPYNLSQWVARDNVVLGQSYIDGAIALDLSSKLIHKIESGDCQFIRYTRHNNNLAITLVKMPERRTVFYWLTIDELRTFPLDIIVEEKPKEEPVPVPSEIQPPNKIVTVKRMLRLHSEIEIWDEEKRAEIVELVINAEGGKPWGRKARNKDGSNKNTDGLTWLISNDADERFYIIDILAGVDWDNKKSDGGINPNREVYATWDVHGPFKPGENGWWTPGKNDSNKPEEPREEPKLNLPTLDQWLKEEYPRLVEAYKLRHNGNEPSHEWAAFQTCRRGGVMLAPGEKAWPFDKMLAHELNQ